MSYRIPIDVLESRILCAATPLNWPFQGPGVSRIGRTLYVAGTDNADTIRIDVVPRPGTTEALPKRIQVVFNNLRVNGQVPQLDAAPLRRVVINGAGGNDSIIINTGLTQAFRPKVFNIRGGAGNDTITGGDQNEYILGEAGDDILNGRAGVDRIDGGDGNDTITGGPGRDVLIGGLGNDTFKNLEPGDQRPASGPGSPRDLLLGGPGTDSAQSDPADKLKDIETPNAA